MIRKWSPLKNNVIVLSLLSLPPKKKKRENKIVKNAVHKVTLYDPSI